MARPIWKGALSFGLVTIPIGLYSAVERPGGKGATKAYALLRDALEETKRVGIGMLVMRQREHLVAVEPAGDLLSVTTMRWKSEIRSSHGFDVPGHGDGYVKKEMNLALQL